MADGGTIVADTFQQRMEALSQAVGDGKLTGRVVVDQRYAEVQHQNTSYKHPRGGKPEIGRAHV